MYARKWFCRCSYIPVLSTWETWETVRSLNMAAAIVDVVKRADYILQMSQNCDTFSTAQLRWIYRLNGLEIKDDSVWYTRQHLRTNVLKIFAWNCVFGIKWFSAPPTLPQIKSVPYRKVPNSLGAKINQLGPPPLHTGNGGLRLASRLTYIVSFLPKKNWSGWCTKLEEVGFSC